MPCFSGTMPVTMLFQMRGEAMGLCERSGPDTPSRAMAARFGSFPSSSRGSMMRRLAPSMPIRTTRPVWPREAVRSQPAAASPSDATSAAVRAAATGNLRFRTRFICRSPLFVR